MEKERKLVMAAVVIWFAISIAVFAIYNLSK
jgi:hypothetical protein